MLLTRAAFSMVLLGPATLLTALAQAPMVAQPLAPAKAADPADVPSTFRTQVIYDQRTEAKSPRNRTNKLHCFVCENDLNPVVAVFARSIPKDADAPLAKLLLALNTLATNDKLKAENFGTFAVLLGLEKEFHLDEKRDAVAAEVKAFGEAVKATAVPLGLGAGASNQVTNWKIGPEEITVVFYHRLKEVKRWTFAAGQPDAAGIDGLVAVINGYFKLKAE